MGLPFLFFKSSSPSTYLQQHNRQKQSRIILNIRLPLRIIKLRIIHFTEPRKKRTKQNGGQNGEKTRQASVLDSQIAILPRKSPTLRARPEAFRRVHEVCSVRDSERIP